jgi:multiple sugar transport system permease protein
MKKKKEQGKGRKLTDAQVGFLLILPGITVFVAIILYPFIDAIITSFTNRSMIYPNWKWVGFTNYIKVLSDPYFFKTLMTTIIFVLGSTVLPYVLGFIWAIDLNQKFKGSEFLRGVTLVDWIIPGTAIGFLWSWIFNGQFGILNSILMKLGLIDTDIVWLGQNGTALLCVIIARTWQMLPWYMAFLLGGLGSVSLEQVEAAHIDGAGNWKTFWHVIVPNMKQTAVLVFILGIIGNLQHFDLPWTMTQGGPARATTTLSIEVFTTAFKNWDMGKAATVGTIWAILLACFSILYIRKINSSDD